MSVEPQIRRAFLKQVGLSSCAVALLRAKDAAASSALRAFKLGAISDGFSPDLDAALGIMKGYGLSWVEIRQVYGVYNTEASPDQIKRMKEAIARHGFRVSVIDSALYKCELPGTTPVKGDKAKFGYSQQMELLKRAMDRATTLGADKIRAFTFWRVAQPQDISARIAEELQKAAELASRSKIRLVIENEESCNAATAHELSNILAHAPASNLGVNWDVGNGYWEKEVSYPAGYQALDKKRIWHLHLKGVTCQSNLTHCVETTADQGQINLTGQLRQLLKDGYQETMSLECEFVAPGMTHEATSRRSLEGLLKVMQAAVAK